MLTKDRKGLLRSLLDVVKACAELKVWTVVLSYLVFVAAVVVLAHSVGAWSGELLKDTLIGVFVVGFPILFNSAKFGDGLGVVKHVVKEVLGVTALLVVYLNLVLFPLWGELVLQVVLLFFVMFSVVGKRDPGTAAVGSFFDVLMALIGIGLTAHVAIQVASGFNEFDWEREATAFALSVWLPVSLIPFIYVLGLIASCEATLVRAKFLNGRQVLPLAVRLAFLLGVLGSLRYATCFAGRWLPELAKQKSFRDASRIMREYRRSVRHRARQNRERRRRLRKQAGAIGVDENGRWLDRREFHETKEALDGIFYTQMGLYRHRGGRYWTDPIVVLPVSGFRNLPQDHGVDFCVRDDGQAWAAWRHTVGGFCLGVGGTQDLEERWRYAGTESPSSYPGSASLGWVDVSADSGASPEWHADDAPIPDA
ncbi:MULTISPECIES: hypothetical protein [unclassified Actinomyces]|uniref:hypothetical protein n=1 Tax=unclassified Actinomyces TaxID=2609248 RepID=UPI002017FF95|nr:MULTISPECIES: hypothetical protein [unclassified Actinomyces]MCL3789875.1 hypothetical protein [Actinomyces sp. 187325]MCL3792212.1 hypothetical protein [Actinomyces sp. 186855]MCL3794774.1 hypothetical protein [Actinomyces sp. 217892]